MKPVSRPATVLLLAVVGVTRAADDAATVQRDVRNDRSSNGLYVVFGSRKTANVGMPGHAFVVWGKDDDRRQVCSAEAFGFQGEFDLRHVLVPRRSFWRQVPAPGPNLGRLCHGDGHQEMDGCLHLLD